jgi:predicted transcriptional regulator
MAAQSDRELSRRERQIMDIIYGFSEASARDVLNALPDPPSYSSVRALMRILEEKGHLTHRTEGARYVYRPTRPRGAAARSALRRVLKTFFEGSTAKAVAALLDASDADLTDDELARLARLIETARNEGGR